MRLSGCLIVKDEAQTLNRCLDSLQNLVDETLVVDTGSTDGSLELVKSRGVRVSQIPWTDDFARARNYALSQITGDWVVFLDADEYIKVNPDWLRSVLPRVNADSLLCSLYNVSQDGETLYNTGSVIRIFRLSNSIRFVRSIHEYLVNGVEPVSHCDMCEHIAIYHTGYSPHSVQLKNKFHRNRAMLLKELRRDRCCSDLHYYLAETYLLGHNFHRAVQRFQRAVELDRFTHVHPYWVMARQLLAMIESGEYPPVFLLTSIDKEIERRPLCPELWAYRGMVLAEMHQREECAESLKRASYLHEQSHQKHRLYADIRRDMEELLVAISQGVKA